MDIVRILYVQYRTKNNLQSRLVIRTAAIEWTTRTVFNVSQLVRARRNLVVFRDFRFTITGNWTFHCSRVHFLISSAPLNLRLKYAQFVWVQYMWDHVAFALLASSEDVEEFTSALSSECSQLLDAQAGDRSAQREVVGRAGEGPAADLQGAPVPCLSGVFFAWPLRVGHIGGTRGCAGHRRGQLGLRVARRALQVHAHQEPARQRDRGPSLATVCWHSRQCRPGRF